MPCSRALRDHDLAVPNAKVAELESIRIKGVLASFRGWIVVSADPAQYVYRKAGAQQVRQRRQAVAGKIVRRYQCHYPGYELHLFA